MPDFDRSARVAAAPDAAFDYLANPVHLPEFVSTMTEARRANGNGSSGLHVAARVNGRLEEGEANFSADRSSRTIEWDGGHDYSGSMRVRPDDAGNGSLVSIHLHTSRDTERADIEQALDSTMSNLASRLSDL